MDNVRVLRIETDAAQKSVKDLRKELKDLRDTLLNTEQGTDEYNKALQQAADIQHTLKEQMEEVNASAMDFGQIAGNVVKTAGAMVAGFQAAQAALNLFGVENEEVVESLKKMQSLMALTQAIPALDDGVKAFKRLKIAIQTATGATSKFGKALISTGLGAIIAALGYIIANFDDISKWLDKVTGQTDFLGELSDKVVGGLNAGWEAIKQTLKGVGKAVVTYVVSPFKSVWAAIQAYTSTEGGFADKLKAAGKAMKSEFVDEWKDVGSEFKKIGEVAVAGYYEGYDKHKAKRLAESEEERKARLKAEEEYAKQVAEIRKKYEELNDKVSLYGATELEKRLAEIKKSLDKEVALLDEALKKKVISQEQYEKDRKAIEDHYAKERANAEKEAFKKEQEERIKTSIDLIDTSHKLELARLQSQYDEKLISEEEFNNRKKELQTAYVQDYVDNIKYLLETEEGLTDEQILSLTEKMNAARASIAEKTDTSSPEALMAKGITEAINASALALGEFSDNPAWGTILKNIATLTANWETLHTQIKKGGKEAFSAYAQIAAVGLNAIGTMLTELGNEQDTSNKEGFEAQKKYQYGATVVNMLAGIASAWASSMQLPFPANIIVGTLMSGLMAGTGAMQLAKISKTKFGDKSGASGSSSSASPNSSAVSSVIAPVQYTQDVQGASIEGAIQDSRVYVVESDITDTQDKVSVTESEARY